MENKLTHTEIVEKLIGPIRPIGKSEVDAERFENLKQMCELVNNLVRQIDAVEYDNRGAHEHSIKQARDYAGKFLSDTLGISN